MNAYGHLVKREIELDKILFSAKIDYVTLETHRKIPLPALSGTVRWSRKLHHRQVTIHDVTANDIRLLHEMHGPMRILELEVAIDLRPHANCEESMHIQMLRDILVNLFAMQLDPSAGPGMTNKARTFYRRLDGPNDYMIRPFNKGLPLATDQQLHGWRFDGAQVKAYLKRTDQKTDLKPAQYVARIEVRLAHDGLALNQLHTLGDLLVFQFRKSLSPYFRHMQGTERPARVRKSAAGTLLATLANKQHEYDLESWDQTGIGAFLNGGKRSGSNVRFLRNTPVNNRIGQALTRLERQFQKAESANRLPQPAMSFPGTLKIPIDHALSQFKH